MYKKINQVFSIFSQELQSPNTKMQSHYHTISPTCKWLISLWSFQVQWASHHAFDQVLATMALLPTHVACVFQHHLLSLNDLFPFYCSQTINKTYWSLNCSQRTRICWENRHNMLIVYFFTSTAPYCIFFYDICSPSPVYCYCWSVECFY